MRVFGLPTRLVTDSIGSEPDRPAKPERPAAHEGADPRADGRGPAHRRRVGRRPHREILRRAERPGDTFSECVATLAWLYTALVGGMMSLTAAMSGPLAALRALGVLEEHTSRHRTVATAIYDDLAPLRALVHADPGCWRPSRAARSRPIRASSRPGSGYLQAARPPRHLRERHRPPALPRGAWAALAAIAHADPPAPRTPPRTVRGTARAALVAVQPSDARPREPPFRRDGRVRASARPAAGPRRRRRRSGASSPPARPSGLSTSPRSARLDAGWRPDPPSSTPAPPRSPASGVPPART